MNLPTPRPGLVLHYNYLWRHQAQEHRDHGPYSRPCAIVIAVTREDGRTQVVLAPITHMAPRDSTHGVEVPPAVKSYLGLDDRRSWAITNDLNLCEWPSPDIEPIPAGSKAGQFEYGMLPPKLYDRIRRQILAYPVSPTPRPG